jgi:membrane protease YdiL (CAAX protease family)
MMPLVNSEITRHASHPWRIPQALAVGVGGLSANFTFLFLTTRAFRQWGSYWGLDSFQISMVSTIVSISATCALLTPVVMIIERTYNGTSWWDSIEWNFNRNVYWYILLGVLLAIMYRLGLKIAFSSAGSFDEYRLALSLVLYTLSVVLAQAAVEEIYFRGILFLALANRLGEIAAISIVTIIFIFLHPQHRLHVLPISIVLGIVRIRTRSVASCFACHASYNLFLALYQVMAPS